MRPKLKFEDQMTVEEFLAFTDTRPDEERWELIEGVPILNPSPTSWHQTIAGNIYMALGNQRLAQGGNWVPALGVGTRVPASPRSLPQPDVMVFERPLPDEPLPVTDDALVLFEVLSKSNTKADQAWRRRVYASVPNCQHYVTVSQSKVELIRFDRASGWQPTRLDKLSDSLALPALGRRVAFDLAEIYRWTPLAPG